VWRVHELSGLRTRPTRLGPGGAEASGHGWSEAEPVVRVGPHPIPPRRGGGNPKPTNPMPTPRIFLRPCRGGYAYITPIPRVPLRSTRGYIPRLLRGHRCIQSAFPSGRVAQVVSTWGVDCFRLRCSSDHQRVVIQSRPQAGSLATPAGCHWRLARQCLPSYLFWADGPGCFNLGARLLSVAMFLRPSSHLDSIATPSLKPGHARGNPFP